MDHLHLMLLMGFLAKTEMRDSLCICGMIHSMVKADNASKRG